MEPARALPTYAELIADAAARLAAAGVDTARLDAEVLLAFTLGMNRSALYVRLPEPAGGDVATRLSELVERRARREPIAYITGVQEFWSLPFAVTPVVLIPRPETELLVEIAGDIVRCGAGVSPVSGAERRQAHSRLLRRRGRRDAGPTPEHLISICDVGTGSGCIAIALARELPDAQIVAVDISQDALAVAARNAATHGVSERIAFMQSDVFAGLGAARFDVIVSNPPYLRPGDRLCPEIAFEPQTALEAGADGLAVIRRIIAEAPSRLRPGGGLLMEIGAEQAEAVRALAEQQGFASVAIEPDLAGLPRVLVARVA